MRYIALCAALLVVLPAHADDKLLSPLTAQLMGSGVLPVYVVKMAPAHLKITSLPKGVLAHWNPQTDTFEVSKSIWKHAPQHAKCLLPLLAHETLHAYLYKTAQTHGFTWPVTLQDEVLAHYYQLRMEQSIADYATHCAAWRPQLPNERAAFAQQNWSAFEEAIFMRYSRFEGSKLPPPPLGTAWINQSTHEKDLRFYQHTYRCGRHFSLEKFWRKGGNWLCVKRKERPQLLQSPHYATYQQILHSISL